MVPAPCAMASRMSEGWPVETVPDEAFLLMRVHSADSDSAGVPKPGAFKNRQPGSGPYFKNSCRASPLSRPGGLVPPTVRSPVHPEVRVLFQAVIIARLQLPRKRAADLSHGGTGRPNARSRARSTRRCRSGICQSINRRDCTASNAPSGAIEAPYAPSLIRRWTKRGPEVTSHMLTPSR